jgi:hypothetical protein
MPAPLSHAILDECNEGGWFLRLLAVVAPLVARQTGRGNVLWCVFSSVLASSEVLSGALESAGLSKRQSVGCCK